MPSSKVLEIEAVYDEKENRVWLYKGTNPDDYDIKDNNIYVERSVGFPVRLRFKTNAEIRGIGFVPNPNPKEAVRHFRKGSCGGCFSLLDDFKPGSKVTPDIENTGEDLEAGYTFWFFFPNGAVDPQIYNHGQTTGPGDAPKRAGCLGLLGRLMGGR